jgi:hypothetical protein
LKLGTTIVSGAPRATFRPALARTTFVFFFVAFLVAAAVGLSYIEATNRTSPSSSGPTITLRQSPANQDCSSGSHSDSNANWTEAYVGANESDMRIPIFVVNSSSTASLCVSYRQNPEAAGISGMSEVNISAYVGVPPLQQNQCTSNSPFASYPPLCSPDVSISVQPDHLSFANGSSNQQFFVKLTITVPSNSSGYYTLGVSGLCFPAGIILNQKPSEITASALSNAYSSLYMPSCGPLYGAIGQLVGLSGLSYGYAVEPMLRPES